MPHSVDQQRNLVDSLEHLAAAMDKVIDTLRRDREIALAAVQQLRRDESVVTIAVRNDMSAVRERLTGALHNLDSARAQARREIFHALQREGQSVGQIARLWGISRQLVSRLMRDHGGTAT
jgi:DNA-binding NtrC family response regulator